MYPDPITPRAHPDLLSQPDYDPFKVMPDVLPALPRVFTTAAHLDRARQRVAAGSVVDRDCLERLVASCKLDEPLPPIKPPSGPADWGGGSVAPPLKTAFRNALAWQLTDDPRHRERALQAMRLAAQASARVTKWTGLEHHEGGDAARAYDLLAAGGLDPADDNAFREMLWRLVDAQDRCSHRTCNNHNAMQMVARLSLGAALGDRQTIHDTLYGGQRDGQWRYGLIHLMRHDFLADGMNWEGAAGYHMLVLMMVCECFTIMENLGVDLWRRGWPSLLKDDGFDEHRCWGPKGDKTLPAAFDALLYQAFPNGDYSMLHDQVLGNLRGTWVWWRLFNKAYEVFGEPRYAWALRFINDGKPITADQIPVWFAEGQGDVEFVRFECREYPEGEHPLVKDRQFSLLGRHVGGCSLFPMHGSAVLRSDPTDERSLGAYVYWGPHIAGHRSPAALHVDIHAFGRRAVTAPHLYARGYDEPLHLTWFRSTIAHNTVTLDERAMFPFDFETESLWECDLWRDSLSDSVLESFQSEETFKAVRASNDNVYPGARLDRTVVLADGYLLDVYRVTAETKRQIDWAMHCEGTVVTDPAGEAVDLGQQRGYRHLTDAQVLPRRSEWASLPLKFDDDEAKALLWLDGGADVQLIVAQDPPVDQRRPIGDRRLAQPRTCVMLRTHGRSALFVSLWDFAGRGDLGAQVQGAADGHVSVTVTRDGRSRVWQLPWQGEVKG